MQKKQKIHIGIEEILVCISILSILYGFIGSSNNNYIPDLKYLFNRATQIYTCFQDNNFPWFYYDDFNGVGYGSSFFYGQLTLVPFVFLVPFGISVFLNCYIFVTLLVTYLGVSIFAKRYTKNYKWVGLLYLISTFAYYTFICAGTYTNLLGIGLSFIFLAYCVDFFRDSKSYIPCSILFYILLNTHLISSLLAFIFCVVLFIFYFKKENIENYIHFCLLTILMCSYNICNILYHSDILNRTTLINKNIINGIINNVNGNYVSSVLYLNKIPFGGLLFNQLLGNISYEGYHYLNVVVFSVCVVVFVKSKILKENKRVLGITIICVLLSIISIRFIWFALNSVVNIPIQFPCRFAPYIIVFLLIIMSKYLNKQRIYLILFVSCIPDLFFGSLFTWSTDEIKYNEFDYQIINGEYLDSSFDFNLDNFKLNSCRVIDSNENEYDYIIDKDKVYVTVPEESTTTLQIPKLYYKGYVCVTEDGTELEIHKGYSQFVNVDIENYKGVLTIYYRHPLWLIFLYNFSIILVLFSVVTLYNNRRVEI